MLRACAQSVVLVLVNTCTHVHICMHIYTYYKYSNNMHMHAHVHKYAHAHDSYVAIMRMRMRLKPLFQCTTVTSYIVLQPHNIHAVHVGHVSVHQHHTVSLRRVLQERAPVHAGAQAGCVANYPGRVAGASERHIHALCVVHKADAAAAAGGDSWGRGGAGGRTPASRA